MNVVEPRDWTEISDEALVREPRVSIHMVTYNHEAFLAEAIEGVMRQQTNYAYELVIGEDCSKDSTRRVALDYQHRYPDRVRVIYSDSNVGMLRNCYRVLEACRGEYVFFCEGDDYWHQSQKLQQQTDLLERDQDGVMVHSDYDIRVGSRILKSMNRREGIRVVSEDVFEAFLLQNLVATCTVCLRVHIVREFLRSSFAAKNYAMLDYPLWLFAAKKGSVKYIDESLATYRRTPGSIMNSGGKSAARILASQQRVREDYVEAFGCSQDLARQIRVANNRDALMASALAGDRQLFFNEFDWLRRNNPDWKSDYKNRLRFLIMKLHLSWLLRLRYSIYLRLRLRGFA